MPIIKSAKKRVKIAAKANVRNVRTKRTLRDALKAFSKAVEAGKPSDIQKTQRDVVSALDIAVKKDIIHKNKAARQKAAVSLTAKTAGAKVVKNVPKSKPVAKPTTKKTATTKKPVAKKASIKKPTK